MSNVFKAWQTRERSRAIVEFKRWPIEDDDAPQQYVLTCFEIEPGVGTEWLTSAQAFGTYHECLAEAMAWAGSPHGALVWDQVKENVFDPSGKGVPDE